MQPSPGIAAGPFFKDYICLQLMTSLTSSMWQVNKYYIRLRKSLRVIKTYV